MASYIKKNRIVLLIAGIVLVGLFVHLSSQEKMEDIANTDSIKTSRGIKPPHKGNIQPDFDFGKFPLYFIKNQGQCNQKARFYAKTSHYPLWITREGLVFDTIRGDFKNRKNYRRDLNRQPDGPRSTTSKTQRDVYRLIFRNANKNPEIVPVEKAKLKVNYFKGNDRSHVEQQFPYPEPVPE